MFRLKILGATILDLVALDLCTFGLIEHIKRILRLESQADCCLTCSEP